MRTSFFIFRRSLILFMLIGVSSMAHATDEDDARSIMAVYFAALKSGSVQELATMLTDPLLESRKLLLNKNTAYPAYLKRYYQDATMQVVEVQRTEADTQRVTTEIFFPGDDRPLKTEFLLKQTAKGWKISQEASAQ